MKIFWAVPVALAAALIGQTTRSVWDGVYTPEQAKRGQEVYAKECASCHGPDLSGGESAPPLAGAGFLANWTGQTVGTLFDRTRQSMPQNDPGRLTRAQTADVLAFMFSINRFPSGKSEMDKQTEPLNQIRIDEKSK
jgi:S-disulfanyl-L-cysteine oxidoreductase SoxD